MIRRGVAALARRTWATALQTSHLQAVQPLDKVENSPRLCPRLFGWFFAMVLDREGRFILKLTHFCLACRFPQPSQRPLVGRFPASPALKQEQVEAGNRAPPLLSICAWFAQLPSQVSVADTVVLSACLRAPVADPKTRAARHEDERSDHRLATSSDEPARYSHWRWWIIRQAPVHSFWATFPLIWLSRQPYVGYLVYLF